MQRSSLTWSAFHFCGRKIVILDHFVDVTTAKRYLTDDELQSFEGYLSAPLETTRLIVIAEGKLDSKRRIVKLLKGMPSCWKRLN